MSSIAAPITNLFRHHKLKIIVAALSFVIFALLLFPFDDLSDLATTAVAEMTGNQVFLQFDSLGISLFPSPGLKVSNVTIQNPHTDPIKAETLAISPAFSALLAFKKGITVNASGLFGGSLGLTSKDDEPTAAGVMKQDVSVDAEDLALKSLGQFSSLPINMSGNLDLEMEAVIDPSFQEAPEGEMEANLSNLKIVSLTIPTAMGPMPLENLSFKTSEIKLAMKKSQLLFEDVVLGSPSDEATAQIKGQMDIRLLRSGTSIRPVPGAFDLSIRITAKPSFEKKFGLFLFLENSKNRSLAATPTTSEYQEVA